ncbi:MAG TPA: twin-arginine translocase subunit TatC [Vicinamibacterales bacterium]
MALVQFPGAPAPYEPDDDPLDDDGAGAKMSFLEHLDELRQRIIISLGSLIVGFIIAVLFVERLLTFVYEPLRQFQHDGQFIYTEPMEGFMLRMKLAALVGLLLAMPVILFQAWRFVAPGLYANEKKFVVPFVFLSTLCFTAGAAFAHYVAFPWAMQFFASFEREDMRFLPRIAPVFAMYVKTVLAMGVVFELPTLVFFLAKVGVVTPRWLIRNFKYAALGIFVVAAILTPGTDPVSQFMMAGPMLVLYGLSIGIAWLVWKKRPTD